VIRTRAARGAAVLAVGLAAIACILHVSACKDDGTHVYVARLYVEARDCLGTGSSVDVISGDEPGDCAPICLLQKRAEGGKAIYAATMCAPYPAGVEFDTAGTDPACPKALEALSRGDTCLSDGGTTHPAPEAGTDARADATADAASTD
jgi:hypothetical protein